MQNFTDDMIRIGRRFDSRGWVLGTSGNADHKAPHLHFHVMVVGDDGEWRHGRPIDPRPFLVQRGRAR